MVANTIKEIRTVVRARIPITLTSSNKIRKRSRDSTIAEMGWPLACSKAFYDELSGGWSRLARRA
jgi:hypothetical protein